MGADTRETAVSRREFLKLGMWGAMLLAASVSGLEAIAAGAGPASTAAAIPKELLFNPNWWNRLFAFIMGVMEVPLLEDVMGAKTDEEVAMVFGRLKEFGARLDWGTRVVPVGRAIHPKVEILPIDDFEEILSRSRVSGVAECWCRTTFKNCDAPTNTCIHLSFGEYLPDLMNRGHVSVMPKEDIRKLIRRTEEAGLVHELIRAGDDDSYYVICNCCPCCCAGLRGLLEFGNEMVVKSGFVSETTDKCTGCGKCLDRCHFSARRMENGRAVTDASKCFGCGLCATGCPSEGVFLVKGAGKGGGA